MTSTSRRVVAAVIAAGLLGACGDTEGPEDGHGGESTTTVQDGSGSTSTPVDESPDVYNDEENDGENPSEGGTDAGTN